jgi:hypothetical protein
VLNIKPKTIGMDNSFFRLSSDSIVVIKLVSKAYKVGLDLTVAKIF